MTDREIMQQALDALETISEFAGGEGDVCEIIAKRARLAIAALLERLAHCDRCGKRLGGEGDIHICTPDPIGDAQDKLIAELAAQPEQEPVANHRDLHSHMMVVAHRAVDEASNNGRESISQKEVVRAICKAIQSNKNLLAKLTPPAAQPAPVQEPVQEPVLKPLSKKWKWVLHESFADVAGFDEEGIPSFYWKESVNKFKSGELSAPCKGKNCGSLNGWLHSSECRAEHEAQYTTPPAAQRKPWVGLTDEEIDEAARYCVKSGQSVNAAIGAAEAKLKEKNT